MPKNFTLNLGMIEMDMEIVHSIWRSSHVRRFDCSFGIFCFSYALSSLDHVDRCS